MKNIFVIGARGYHANYGGWETFVTNLVDNYHDKDTVFYVSEYTEDKNRVITKVNDYLYVFPIYVKNMGSATMFLYTIKSFKYVIKYVREKNIRNSYLYILGLKLFYYLWMYENKLKKLNITTIVNPDGLEHMRSKWSYPVKKFFLLSEKLMLKHVDRIVCDAKGIKNYVISKYPKLEDKISYIAYGSTEYNFKSVDEDSILKEYGLVRDKYFLVVGRCVPENNYELIIREFMNSMVGKDLVIVTNLSSGNYYNELECRLEFVKDKRIRFIDGIYDKEKLAVVRKNAYLYIHGHSVGGTNPSLIEALSLTKLNVLYDVCFNHDVGEDACLYFKDEGSLTKIFNELDKYDKKRNIYSKKAKELVKKNYTWDIIVNKYKDIFR